MALRRAVSLVEVLVATVLLAVGISGCLSTLLAAARLREGARVREALADAAHERLSWFEATPCASSDTGGTSATSDGVRVEWQTMTAGDSTRTLALDARAAWGARELRLTLSPSVRCHAD